MKSSMFKKLSLCLSVFLIASTMSACGSGGASTGDSDKSGSDKDGTAVYSIGYNNWGQGVFPLDIIEKETKNATEVFGNKLVVANDEFKADKVISDVQTLISSGVDGIQFFGISETMFNSVSQICQDAKVPFVLFDKIPSNEVLSKLKENPYFVGAISAEDKLAGKSIAEMALKDGCQTAIIVAAAKGDSSHDLRIEGFVEAFTAGGGYVLGEAHCADPTEAVQKSNDLLTAYPDADCIYGTGGDFVDGALNALASRKDANMDPKIYGTDITPDIAQKMVDQQIDGVVGGQWVDGSLANMLLLNYLDGHPILGEDGKAPVFTNLPMCTLAPDQAGAFIKLLENNESPISDEEYQSLTYRFNPEVSYQTFFDFITNYNETFSAKLK